MEPTATTVLLETSPAEVVEPASSTSTTSLASAAPSSTSLSSSDLQAKEIVDYFRVYTPSHRNIKLTVGTSQEYIERMATLASYSFVHDPLTTLFVAERFGLPLPPAPSSTQDIPNSSEDHPPSASTTPMMTFEAEAAATASETTRLHRHRSCLSRLSSKMPHGAFILEANSFSAAVVWEPPHCLISQGEDWAYSPADLAARPIFANFLNENKKVKRLAIKAGEPYWHVSMMARDFDRTRAEARVPGLVRAVLEPGLEAARREGRKVWLESSSERSRDVYAWAGFEVVGMFYSGVGIVDRLGRRKEGGEGLPTWGMVFDPAKEKTGNTNG